MKDNYLYGELVKDDTHGSLLFKSGDSYYDMGGKSLYCFSIYNNISCFWDSVKIINIGKGFSVDYENSGNHVFVKSFKGEKVRMHKCWL